MSEVKFWTPMPVTMIRGVIPDGQETIFPTGLFGEPVIASLKFTLRPGEGVVTPQGDIIVLMDKGSS